MSTMTRRMLVPFTTLVLLVVPGSLTAQWAVEGRIGSAMPSGELTAESGMNQTAGPAFGADATYQFNNTFAMYGGVERQRFNCNGCAADVSSTGFDGGVKLRFANEGSATPWVRGGFMLHQPAVNGDARDWGLGVGSAMGLDWRIEPNVAVVPAVRINSYSSGPMSLTYVTLDAGVRVDL